MSDYGAIVDSWLPQTSRLAVRHSVDQRPVQAHRRPSRLQDIATHRDE